MKGYQIVEENGFLKLKNNGFTMKKIKLELIESIEQKNDICTKWEIDMKTFGVEKYKEE